MTTIIKRIVERERRACVHHDVNRCWRSFVFVVVVIGTALFGLIIFDNNQPADKMQIATPLIAETEAVVVEETMSTETVNSSVIYPKKKILPSVTSTELENHFQKATLWSPPKNNAVSPTLTWLGGVSSVLFAGLSLLLIATRNQAIVWPALLFGTIFMLTHFPLL